MVTRTAFEQVELHTEMPNTKDPATATVVLATTTQIEETLLFRATKRGFLASTPSHSVDMGPGGVLF